MPPRLARLLAAIVAIALVAGAFALRGALSGDDDDGGTASADDGGDREAGTAGTAYRVACDEDLGEEACAAVVTATGAEVEVVPWSDLQAAAATGAPGYDAVLTLDPLPAVLDEARSAAGQPPATSGDPVTVASALLALLARDEVDCDGSWSCILDLAEEEPVGVPRGTTAAGAIVRAAAFAGLVPDHERRGIRGLDEGDNRARLEGLVDSADPLPLVAQRESFLTQAGRYRAIVTTRALAEKSRRGPRGSALTVVAVEPAVTVGVVLVGLGVEGAEAVAALEEGVTGQTVRDALAEGGWDGDRARSAGLPADDLIYALEELG